MQIFGYVLGELFTNTYVVLNDNNIGFIVDPATDDEKFLEEIKDIKLPYIINTHGHFDHICGNGIVKNTKASKIIIHKNDAPMLTDPELNYSIFTTKRVTSPAADITLDSLEGVLNLNGINWKYVNLAGHSEGSIILVNEVEKIIFSGDLIFSNSIGRVDLPAGSSKKMKKSLQFIEKLPSDFMVYPGHGESFLLGDFKKILKYFIQELEE